MRIEPEQIGEELRWMLAEKAKRADLIESGFSVDDALLDEYRSTVAAQHRHDSPERQEAIAVYHALFDRQASHNIEKATTVTTAHDNPAHVDTQLWNANFRSAQANRELVDRGIREISQAVAAASESTDSLVSAASQKVLDSQDGIRQAIRDWGSASTESSNGISAEVRNLRGAVEAADIGEYRRRAVAEEALLGRHAELKELHLAIRDQIVRTQERTRGSVDAVLEAVENLDRNLSLGRTVAARQLAEEMTARRAERIRELRLKFAQIGLLAGILGAEILRLIQ